jgi:dolichol kinase
VIEGGAAPLALRREFARKGLHLLTLAAPIGYAAGLSRGVMTSGLAVLVAIAVVVEVARRRSPLRRAQFEGAVGALLRDHEHQGLSGATWLLIAFLAAVVLAPRDAAIAAMWAVSAGDASASLVGRSVGRVRIVGRKTLEGALAGAVVTSAGAFLLAGLTWPLAIVVGLAAAIVELPAGPGDDNFRVAFTVAMLVPIWKKLLD